MNNISWSELPDSLLLLLLRRVVGLAAYVRLGAVCRPWNIVFSKFKCYQPVPWLMLSEKHGTDLREFYDLSTNEVYELPLPQAKGRKILGSGHGWLITVGEDGHFHLLNPLNGTQITLPPMSGFESFQQHPQPFTPQQVRDLFCVRASLSFEPVTGDFVVMVINLGFNTTCLSYCTSVDKHWSRLENLYLLGISCAYGHFFSVGAQGQIHSYEINPKSNPSLLAVIPPIAYGSWSYYMVECSGKLLAVTRSHDYYEDDKAWNDISFDGTLYRTSSFKVYEVDLETRSLIEIKSIGDNTLFVGFNDAICLPASKQNKAYKRNCIYFLDDYHDGIFWDAEAQGGLDMGVFCLDDMSIKPHYPGISKSNFSMPIWVMPTLD